MNKKLLYVLIPFVTLLFCNPVYGTRHSRSDNSANILEVINHDNVDQIMTYIYQDRNNKIDFISVTSGLSKEDSEFLLEECDSKKLDVFLVLGLMKLESNFDKDAVGTMGERGLGQLMANTAEPIAKNLGIEYDPDLLFEPQYNILLFTTQLRYLKRLFDNDVHKMLTAYNRGPYGLKKYIASRSNRENPAVSSYSSRVLKYKNEFYNSYLNE